MIKPESSRKGHSRLGNFPGHGWIGIVCLGVFWALNWGLNGIRTHYLFFGLWLGYCLVVDALVYWRKGTSLLTRNWGGFIGLFIISAPAWWLFEIVNRHMQNWHYLGAEQFTRWQFWGWATLNFSTVIPAVFGAAELASTFGWVQRLPSGPRIRPTPAITAGFFFAGWALLAAMLAWPHWFFPLVWISIYFILEPVNIWLHRPNLANWTKNGDWRPVIALWVGVLITAFFWEMWNYWSYPKWIYTIPWGDWFKVFEMPLLGYGGYLPFALELYALYNFVLGLTGSKLGNSAYISLVRS